MPRRHAALFLLMSIFWGSLEIFALREYAPGHLCVLNKISYTARFFAGLYAGLAFMTLLPYVTAGEVVKNEVELDPH